MRAGIEFWGVPYGASETESPPLDWSFDEGRSIAHSVEDPSIIYATDGPDSDWRRYQLGTGCFLDSAIHVHRKAQKRGANRDHNRSDSRVCDTGGSCCEPAMYAAKAAAVNTDQRQWPKKACSHRAAKHDIPSGRGSLLDKDRSRR